MGTGAGVHLGHVMLHVGGAFGIELAVLFDQARGHGAVGVGAFEPLKALGLHEAGLLDPGADDGGGLAGFAAGEGFVIHQGDIDMEVDAVEERAADAVAILLHHGRGAATGAFEIAIVTALAGIKTRVKASVKAPKRFGANWTPLCVVPMP